MKLVSFHMESSRGPGYLAITILVGVLSIVVGSQARGPNPNALSNLFTTWTPENCNFSSDGREVQLILKTNTTRECHQLRLGFHYLAHLGSNSLGVITGTS